MKIKFELVSADTKRNILTVYFPNSNKYAMYKNSHRVRDWKDGDFIIDQKISKIAVKAWNKYFANK